MNRSTFLGYRNAKGEEMHCAHAKCLSPDMCIKGCVCPHPSEPNYISEPSYDVLDALRLVLLFYSVDWTDEKRAEWLRITGTPEATTKVMCDHVRSAIECANSIRAATIEECAQVAEAFHCAQCGVDAAAAIRALKEQK